MTTLLDRVTQLCNARGVSIAELERRADLGNGSIRRWKNSIPSADKLQRTAKVLGVSMSYLLNGTENDTPTVLARDVNGLTKEQLELIYSMIDHFRKENNLD